MKTYHTHKDIQDWLVCQYPEVRTTGFQKAVNELTKEDFDGPLPVSFIPDAYAVRPGEMDLFEVDISHVTSIKKLEDICLFYGRMYSFDVEVRLYMVNQFGHVNEVDLAEYYLQFCLAGCSGAADESGTEDAHE